LSGAGVTYLLLPQGPLYVLFCHLIANIRKAASGTDKAEVASQ